MAREDNSSDYDLPLRQSLHGSNASKPMLSHSAQRARSDGFLIGLLRRSPSSLVGAPIEKDAFEDLESHATPHAVRMRKKRVTMTEEGKVFQREKFKLKRPSDMSMMRIGTCVLAISLLWMTSVGVSVAISERAISKPDGDDVVMVCKSAYDEVLLQNEKYEECANNQTQLCETAYLQGLEDEQKRVANLAMTNEESIDVAVDIAHRCRVNYIKAVRAVADYVGVHSREEVKFTDLPRCQLNKTQEHIFNLAGEAAVIQSNTLKLVRRNNKESESNFGETMHRADARISYDLDYINKHTLKIEKGGEEVDEAGGNAGTSMEEHFVALDESVTRLSESSNTSLSEMWDTNMEKITRQFTDAQAQSDTVMDDVNRLLKKMRNVSNQVVRLRRYCKKHKDILGFVLDKVGIDLGEENTEETKPTFPALVPTVPVEEFNDVIQANLAAYRDDVEEAKRTARYHMGELSSISNNTVQDLRFPKHDPPAFNSTGETEVVQKQNKQYEGSMGISIGQMGDNSAFGGASYETKPVDVLLREGLAYVGNLFYGTYMPPGSQTYGLDWTVIQLLSQAGFLFILFDYLYRAVRSLEIVRKLLYTKSSQCETVDLRDKPAISHSIFDIGLQNMSPGALAFKAVSSQKVMPALFATFVCVLVYVMSGIYVKFYDGYVEGCVDMTPNDGMGGTMLTENLHSFAYNYASSEGDSVLTQYFETYNANASAFCGNMQQDTGHNYLQQKSDMDAAIDYLENLRHDTVMLQECLEDVGSMKYTDKDVNKDGKEVIRETVALSWLLEETLECAAPLEKDVIEDSTFLCPGTKSEDGADSLVPQCLYGQHVTCNGVEDTIVREHVQRCGCFVEWWFHSQVMGVVTTVVVFICLNASRDFIMEAAQRFNWRILQGEHPFSVVVDVAPTGQPDAGQMHHAKKGVRRTARKYEQQGWVYALAAILVHIPWLWLMAEVGSNIEYKAGLKHSFDTRS